MKLIDAGLWADEQANNFTNAIEQAQIELNRLHDDFDAFDPSSARALLAALKKKLDGIESVIEDCEKPPRFAPEFDPIPNSYFL